jgi:hypothetical protein
MNTHLLPIPFELAEIINSFAYYDWRTWMRLERERLFMKDLRYRMIHCYNNPMNNDDDDTLTVWLAVPPNDRREIQFQPVFCKKCGNYIFRKPYCSC